MFPINAAIGKYDILQIYPHGGFKMSFSAGKFSQFIKQHEKELNVKAFFIHILPF
jgi:hypothetical protein